MEQSNKIQRSEVWEQIYKIVKTIPRADCKTQMSSMALVDGSQLVGQKDEKSKKHMETVG